MLRMNDELMLVEPSEEYFAELAAYRNDFLENSDLTISEITWKAGFSSPGYMGKCFKEYFGVTPLQYRNSKK